MCHSVDVNVFSCNDNTFGVAKIKMEISRQKQYELGVCIANFNPDALVHSFCSFCRCFDGRSVI